MAGTAMSIPKIPSEPKQKDRDVAALAAARSPLAFHLEIAAAVWGFSALSAVLLGVIVFFMAMGGPSTESGMPDGATMSRIMSSASLMASAMLSWTLRLLCLAAVKIV